MPATITNQFRVQNAEEFLNTFGSQNFYLLAGRVRPWSDDSAPPDPKDQQTDLNEVWLESIAAKKVSNLDVTLSVPRIDWESGTAYVRYSSHDEALFEKAFYVITDEYHVYKCLDNNNGANSTVKPTGTGTTPITTGDGYTWKYLFTVSTADTEKFMTPQHIPVKRVTSNDGSNQWQVQDSAVPGEIVSIDVTAGGSGYTSAGVTIDGDGTGATATAVINNGSISRINVTNFGQDYSYATITVTGDGSGATARANIAPPEGHGANPPEELGAYYTTISISYNFDESGTFSTENDYRRVALVNAPYAYGTTNEYTSVNARMTTKLSVSNVAGTFEKDEKVVDGTSGAYGYVVEHDETNGDIYVNFAVGAFGATNTITGQTSGATADVDSTTDPDIEPFTGRIFYVENRRPIVRSSEQRETISTTLEW